VIDAVLLALLAGLMHTARTFSAGGQAAAGTSLGFGYLLLTAFLSGRIFAAARLPKLTGYIAAGVVVGPSVVGFLDATVVDNLQIVNGVAVSLIALTAGTELRLDRIRPLARTIGLTTALGVFFGALAIAATVFLLRGQLAFLSALPAAQAAAVALVLGVVLVAQSPAVVVALSDELRADGPVTRTVLGVVVLADLFVIVLFALASAGAKAALGAGGARIAVGHIAWELLGSIVAGFVLAALVAAYLRWVRRGSTLFLLTAAFVVAEVGQRIGFDPLLVSLTAGVLVRNLTALGDELHELVGGASLPVYVIFFAVTGAKLHLAAVPPVAVPVLAIVAVRAASLLTAGRAGARLAGAPPEVARWAPYGLLPQAGVALALALLFTRAFPEFGGEASAVALGVVALNELVAPAVYRLALVRSGEAGRTRARATPAPARAPPRAVGNG
jgi:Kef-type K+ transport system membrane component KefB